MMTRVDTITAEGRVESQDCYRLRNTLLFVMNMYGLVDTNKSTLNCEVLRIPGKEKICM